MSDTSTIFITVSILSYKPLWSILYFLIFHPVIALRHIMCHLYLYSCILYGKIVAMTKTTLIIIALFASLTLAVTACGKDSEESSAPLIDPKGDSARESVNKYVGTALHVKDSAQEQVDASEERQRMMESLGDE